MNVLYDIALLGKGHKDNGHKTGLFRVTEAVAEQLAASPECTLRFCASEHGASVRAYHQAAAKLRGVPFMYAPAKLAVRGLRDAADRRVRAVAGGERHSTALQPLRMARKALHVLDSTLGIGAKPLEDAALGWADMYHSSYLALPPQAKRARGLARCLTVYDLIPILHPQHFGEESRAFGTILTRIVQSVGPEDMAVCISQATKDDFCEYTGHDPARTAVTYLAADSGLFYRCTDATRQAQVREKYGIPPGPYLLSLSTLAPHKNIGRVVKSFARLAAQENVGDLCLVLAGAQGWDAGGILEAVAAQQVKDKIIVTGRVDDKDLASLYSGALAFAYMSYYEGFGLPPLEAMQCGVPVIVSNTSSLPEVVGEAGILLDPDDGDRLCAAMLSLYQSADLRAEMAQKSLARAGVFSWQRCGQETVAAYRVALAG